MLSCRASTGRDGIRPERENPEGFLRRAGNGSLKNSSMFDRSSAAFPCVPDRHDWYFRAVVEIRTDSDVRNGWRCRRKCRWGRHPRVSQNSRVHQNRGTPLSSTLTLALSQREVELVTPRNNITLSLWERVGEGSTQNTLTCRGTIAVVTRVLRQFLNLGPTFCRATQDHARRYPVPAPYL